MTNKNMTKEQALNIFKQEILPMIKEKEEQNGVKDIPARRYEWSTFVDSLQKDGQITENQAHNWDNPF